MQDPYSLRCQPQVMGACLDLLRTASATLLREANAVTDNPLVFRRQRSVLSGGNFHAEPVAFAADQLALAVAEIGSIVERRIALLVDTKMSGLPTFPGGQQRRELWLHGGAGHGGRAGFRKQVPRAPGQRRQHPDFRQPGRSCVDGDLRGPAPARHGRERRGHCQRSSFWRPRRVWISIVRCSVPRPSRLRTACCARRVPVYARDRHFAPDIAAAREIVAGGLLRDHVNAACFRAKPASSSSMAVVQTFPTHTLLAGNSPLIISVPHAGTAVPQDLAPRLTPMALDLPDTDWHVARLYDFAPDLGATMIVARYTRYLIDLNRPPDDAALYSSATQTGLCPMQSFDGAPLYRDGTERLSAEEIEKRREQYWQPYHDALRTHLEETHERFGYALLLDAHSIRSMVPRLFAGRLPDVNVGTFDGRSCTRRVNDALGARLSAAPQFSHVFDGRFKGGYITRHYGQPSKGQHALQIELSQSSYMDESGTAYEMERAAPLRELLHGLVVSLLGLSPTHS